MIEALAANIESMFPPFPASKSRRLAPVPRRLGAALACLIIVAVGALLRLLGTEWDQGANLHPDERHMMFVVMDTMRAFDEPESGELSVSEMWFAAGKSPLDPRRKDQLYVYGELPHLVVSLASRIAGGGWPEILLRGRTIGSVIDSYTILAVFLLAGAALRSMPASLGAAALYAFAPLAIQNANFFTVDIWLVAACTWCLVAATMLIQSRNDNAAFGWAAASGVLAGLALSCKLPGLALIAVVEIAILVRWLRAGRKQAFVGLAATMMLALGAAFVVFRLASPFNFQGPDLLGLWPAARVLEGYMALDRLYLDPNFPPNWQWIAGFGRPPRALLDLAVWGLGVPASGAVLAGVAHLLWRGRSNWPGLVPVGVCCAVFIAYWILGPAPALRYVLPALPGLCVFGGSIFVFAAGSTMRNAVSALLVALAGIWSLGLVSLHAGTHSRVAASRWLWTMTAPGTVLLNETGWDDGLPVPVRLPGQRDLTWAGQGGHFTFETLGLEAPDSAAKASKMAELLGKADLAILSSERMRRPIVALSGRFPMTAAYYRMLANGELCFERVYRNQSGYPVLGIAFGDDTAQEPWTIYDHPTVEIYRRLGCYDRERVESRLIEALQDD